MPFVMEDGSFEAPHSLQNGIRNPALPYSIEYLCLEVFVHIGDLCMWQRHRDAYLEYIVVAFTNRIKVSENFEHNDNTERTKHIVAGNF